MRRIDKIPIVVDLDGTLIKTDMLLESANQFVFKHPLNFVKLFFYLTKGKLFLKEKLSQDFSFDPSILPYNKKILNLLKEERKLGRPLVLATATNLSIANKISDYLKLFDIVIASSSSNIKGSLKLKALKKAGIQKFDYIGNSHADIPLWESSRNIFLANKNRLIIKSLIKRDRTFISLDEKSSFMNYLNALRPHHWLKNLLLFVPIISSKNLDNISMILDVGMGFLVFSLIASSVYLTNDLVDLNYDRKHSIKKHRPLASGSMDILHGWTLSFFLLFLGFSIAFFMLPKLFLLCLITYFFMTLAYSFFLKSKLAADLIMLSSLYTCRVIAGSFAIDLPVSYWILVFCIFIFTSLALVKRCAEIINLIGANKLSGRGYSNEDLLPLMVLGISSGLISVLVLALYLNDQKALFGYTNPKFLWLSCPLLMFWFCRLWLLTFRGSVNEDPVLFAIRDRVSLQLFILLAFLVFLAL